MYVCNMTLENFVEEFDTEFHGPRKTYFLTWAQSTGKLDYKDVYDFLKEMSTHLIVCLEHHKDGAEHVHALAILRKRGLSKAALLKLCQARWPELSNVHIRKARSAWHAWHYCKKEGTFLASSTECPIKRGKAKARSLKKILTLPITERQNIMDAQYEYLWDLC